MQLFAGRTAGVKLRFEPNGISTGLELDGPCIKTLKLDGSLSARNLFSSVNLIKMVGGSPLIVKLLEGTQGKGVVLAETKKAAETLINFK